MTVKDISVQIEDHKDGTYDLEFVPEVSGKYDVIVGLGDADGIPDAGEAENIQNFEHSPFITEINPSLGASFVYTKF